MSEYRVVRLLRNQLYPTFQLYARMLSEKTKPMEGLRLAALITMDWLRQRMGENVPPQLQEAPRPEAWKNVGNDCLFSLRINAGYVVDIVHLPEKGVWSLQITEPDLGSDPGNEQQGRAAVPGRVIETNIGFHVKGKMLECGFQTIISDLEGTEGKAEVYRLSPVRRLLEHPDFGLWQGLPLEIREIPLESGSRLREVWKQWKDQGNQLPVVIFTQLLPQKQPMMELDFTGSGCQLMLPGLNFTQKDGKEDCELPYAVSDFARKTAGICRTYRMSAELLGTLNELAGQVVNPGDIVVVEPSRFGGTLTVLPWKKNKHRQEEYFQKLSMWMHQYPREKSYDFGQVVFPSEARKGQEDTWEQLLQEAHEQSGYWSERLDQVNEEWKSHLHQEKERVEQLREQLERQREYTTSLERDKKELLGEVERLKRDLDIAREECREEMDFLRRRQDRPSNHEDIPAWVSRHFGGRLLLHSKAVGLLQDRSAKGVDMNLICDAIDYLATDYRDCRYRKITQEEADLRCSQKYGRRFDIRPVGVTTIEYTPVQYKIKYFPGAKGKLVESPLDWHLCVGSDPETLLRIYFLHDDDKKLIVVGSLPRHLKSVTIQ